MKNNYLDDEDELLYQDEGVLAAPPEESARPSAMEEEAPDGADEELLSEGAGGEALVSLSEVSLNTLYALRRDHLYWCIGAGFALVVGQLLPSTHWVWTALRLIICVIAGLVGLSRVWYLNGVEQEIRRREQAEGMAEEEEIEDVE